MKKMICIVLFSGCLASAHADSLGFTIATPQFDGGIIIAGAVPPAPQVAYVQPVVYAAAPVIYNAPVVYNAPVIYNQAPVPVAPPDCEPVACAVTCPPESSVQVIHFGGQQGAREGYNFNAPR